MESHKTCFRGLTSETITGLALMWLKGEGKIENFEFIDLPGKDWLIIYKGKVLYVETKSSAYGALVHNALYKDSDSFVIVVTYGRARKSTRWVRIRARKLKPRIIEELDYHIAGKDL